MRILPTQADMQRASIGTPEGPKVSSRPSMRGKQPTHFSLVPVVGRYIAFL
jgi:hypothetical protein